MKKLFFFSLAALLFLGCVTKSDIDKLNERLDELDKIASQPEAVDLGLPSGLKWASFNLGASKEYEYGDYYAWGETATKEDFSWATYAHATGVEDKLIKYCPLDKKEYWNVASASGASPRAQRCSFPALASGTIPASLMRGTTATTGLLSSLRTT